jgi:regulator of protease activity HflC (stomatin/prohibitin superfamily)
MVEMNVQTMKWENKTVAYTKDVQQADISYAITYNLRPDKAREMYQTIGTDWPNALLPQVVEQTVKNVLGQSEAVKDAINARGLM